MALSCGRLLSDGTDNNVEVTEILKGVEPNEYKAYDVPQGTRSLELGDLTTGQEYFVRVATITDSGLGMFSEATSLAPVKAPGQLSSISLRPITDSLVQVRFTDDVDNGGSALTHFVVDWDTSSHFGSNGLQSKVVPVSNKVQKITTSAVTAPISGSFRLSLGDYHGDFTVRVGGASTFADIDNGASILTISTPDAGMHLYQQIARGDFIRVVGQDFRICLNPHDGLYDSETLPLCTVADAWVPAVFEFNCELEYQGPCTSGGVTNVPMWKLDTSLGAAFDIRLGDNFIKTEGNPSYDDLAEPPTYYSDFIAQGLEVGDFIRIGHPFEGQVMRVSSADGGDFSAQMVDLASTSDSDDAASITSTALLSGGVTREVQKITITSATGSTLQSGTLSFGFGEEQTECISYDVMEQELKDALEALDAIQEVEVSKTVLSVPNGFEYLVTFVGNQNTGNQSPIMAIVQPGNADTVSLDTQPDSHAVLEDNSCGCADFAALDSAVDPVQITLDTVEYAFAPVYKMQTTENIPFDASSEDMKAALEELSLVCTVDVSRSTNRHGYEWIVEFSSHKTDEFNGDDALLLPIVASHTDLHAVQVPDAVVLNMYKVDLPALAGVPHYVRVAAANAAGVGATSISSPSSVQPSNQLPGRPADVTIRPISPTELMVEWELPNLNGGLPIHSYKVEWDSHDAFAQCDDCTDTVFSTAIEPISDVQLITTSVTPDSSLYIGGSFTLLFDGQKTRQIPWDASAEEMKEALEELCTVDTISVSRELGPQMKTTPGTPGIAASNFWTGPELDRGYSWLVTFSKMDYAGSQFNDYNSELEYTISHKLSVHDSHLLSCDSADRSNCANDGEVSISVGTRQEEQQIFCASPASSTFQVTFMGYSTEFIESTGDVAADVKAALESLPSIGRVDVTTAQTTLCEETNPSGITVTFETELGDLPPMSIYIRAE